MPLSRSNTSRSKSRSPAPPSPSPRPLNFLPPSHYAAAGGFVLPERSQSCSLSEGTNSNSPSHSQDAYIPVSFNKQASSESGRKRRESQIQNLPFMEAQLLPSLRDTIDRMTRPPSRINNSGSNSNPTSTPTFKVQGSEEDGSTSPYLSPRSKPPTATYHTPDDRLTTPKQISMQKSSVLKSALKAPTPKISSSLKSENAPVTSSPGGGALKSVRSLLRRKSSASAVQTSSSDQSTKENQPATPASFSVTRQNNTRSRSRTDPGTVPPKDLSYVPNAPTTPQPPSQSSKSYQTSHIPRFRGAGSGTKLTPAGTKRVFNGVSTDESDFEYRYEVEGRERRKLTVANAEVVASSSSSSEAESDVDLYQHQQQYSTYGYSQAQRLPGRQIKGQVQGEEGTGLGLMFKEPQYGFGAEQDGEDYHYDHHLIVQEETNDYSSGPGPGRHFSVASYPSAESIYTDDDAEEFELDTSHSSRNGQSSSSDAQDFENRSPDLSQLDETHSRRKAALLGLVRGLEDEHSGQSPSNANANRSASGSSILSEGESDYSGEKGLAVSGSLGAGSGSRFDSGVRDSRYDDEESESEYGFHVNDGAAASGVDRTQSRPKSSGVSISSTASTPRTPAVPPPPPVSGMLRRASQYHLKSPTIYSEGPVDTANNGDSKSYSSKRYSLHASSLSPRPGPYDHLPPSPRISTSAIAGAEGDRDKPPGGDSGGLRASHLQARSSPEELIGKRQENEKESRRKSYNNIRDLSSGTNSISPRISAAKSPSSLAPPSPHALSSSLPRDGNSFNYESVVLSKRSQEVVVRTRQAFGIPPSESEEIYHRDTADERNREADSTQVSTLTPADSMASGVDVVMDRDSWEHEGDNELSVGAENLFRTLSLGESENEIRGRSHRSHEGRKSHRYEQQEQQQFSLQESLPERNEKSRSRERRHSRHRSRTPVARPKSVQRTPPVSESNQQENLGSSSSLFSSWRSIVDSNTYRSLIESHGEMEGQRQEVIWELRNAETSFAKRLSSVVDLFILPLRVHASKSWIAGVPFEIAKILDWLEDIINLHTRISDTLQSFQTPESPLAGTTTKDGDKDKGGVANALRTYVPRLEMYQPYLIKIAGVLEMLERLVRDDESDFGEFVRIQEKTAESRASLASLLLEPVNRLASYPDLFRKLLDVTPKTHDEYLSTLMLVHSTALVVKTLMAVKAREEEYELVKSISERIDGLPSAMNLARRERRLLCHGQLLRMDSYHLHNQQHSFDQREPNQFNKSPNRMSRLVDAINEWDFSRRSRSDSVKSNNSASTGVSFRSVETSSPPPPPQILVLVFSDLVVFATNRSHTQEQQGSERWNVCEDVGVARVLGVSNRNGQDNVDEPASITVDVLPVQSEPKQRSTSTGGTCIKTLQLKLPPSTTTSNPSRDSWLNAFLHSSQSTLRILSDPGLSRTSSSDIDEPNHLLEQDRRRILESILETGLPLPKSPSLQLANESVSTGLGKTSDSTQMEREERGWWSLQFQELLRESWYGLASHP